jgi:hypothetical protein
MDQRIEAFLADVLALAGEEPDKVCEGVRVALADCEAIFRAQETNKRMRDQPLASAARCAALAWPRSCSVTAHCGERLAGEPHTRLRYFCSPQHTDSAFYPIISQMERAAGLVHDDTAQVKLDKLDAVLAQTSTSPQDAALFAELPAVSLPHRVLDRAKPRLVPAFIEA